MAWPISKKNETSPPYPLSSGAPTSITKATTAALPTITAANQNPSHQTKTKITPANQDLLSMLNKLLYEKNGPCFQLMPQVGELDRVVYVVENTNFMCKVYMRSSPACAECIAYAISNALYFNIVPRSEYVAADSAVGQRVNTLLGTTSLSIVVQTCINQDSRYSSAYNEEEYILFRWVIGSFMDNNFVIDSNGKKWGRDFFQVGGPLYGIVHNSPDVLWPPLNVQRFIALISTLPTNIPLNVACLPPLSEYAHLPVKIDIIRSNLSFLKLSVKICKQSTSNQQEISFGDLMRAMKMVAKQQDAEAEGLYVLEKKLVDSSSLLSTESSGSASVYKIQNTEYVIKAYPSHVRDHTNSERLAYALSEYLKCYMVPFTYFIAGGSEAEECLSKCLAIGAQLMLLQKDVQHRGAQDATSLQERQRAIFFTWIIGYQIKNLQSNWVIDNGKVWERNVSPFGFLLREIVMQQKLHAFYPQDCSEKISRELLQWIMDCPDRIELDSALYHLHDIAHEPWFGKIVSTVEANLRLLKQVITPYLRLVDRGFEVRFQNLFTTLFRWNDEMVSIYDPQPPFTNQLALLDNEYESFLRAHVKDVHSFERITADMGPRVYKLRNTDILIITDAERDLFIEEYLSYEISKLLGLNLWPNEHLVFPGSENYKLISKSLNQIPWLFRLQQHIAHHPNVPWNVDSVLKALMFMLILGVKQGKTVIDQKGNTWLHGHQGMGQEIKTAVQELMQGGWLPSLLGGLSSIGPEQHRILAGISQWLHQLPEKIEFSRCEFSYYLPSLFNDTGRARSIHQQLRQGESNLKLLKEAIDRVYYRTGTFNLESILNELSPRTPIPAPSKPPIQNIQPTSTPLTVKVGGGRTVIIEMERGKKLKDIYNAICEKYHLRDFVFMFNGKAFQLNEYGEEDSYAWAVEWKKRNNINNATAIHLVVRHIDPTQTIQTTEATRSIACYFRYGRRSWRVHLPSHASLKDLCDKLAEEFKLKPALTLVRILYRATLLTRPENLSRNIFELQDKYRFSNEPMLMCLPLTLSTEEAQELCSLFRKLNFPGYVKFDTAEASLQALRTLLWSACDRLFRRREDAGYVELGRQLDILRTLSTLASTKDLKAYLEYLIQELSSAYSIYLTSSARSYDELVAALAKELLPTPSTNQERERLSSGDETVVLHIREKSGSVDKARLTKLSLYCAMYVEQLRIHARMHGEEEGATSLDASIHLFDYLDNTLKLDRLTDSEVGELLATAESFIFKELSYLCQCEFIVRLKQGRLLTPALKEALQQTTILQQALSLRERPI